MSMFTSTTSFYLSLSLFLSLFLITHNSEYESIFANQRLKWRVKGNNLHCVSSGVFIEATVLAEELAYNRSLRQYKMFILERPLDPNFKVCSSTHTMLSYTVQECQPTTPKISAQYYWCL